MCERDQVLEHLNQEYSEPLRDPVWKNISLSQPLLKLIGLPVFQKLNRIKQLGPTYLVYPGATHTRLNHSLGVFHIARRMITHLLKKEEIASCTLTGVKAFLCAALLHDLGHYPYAHSLKELEIESHETLTAGRICEDDFSTIIKQDLGTDPLLIAAIIDPGFHYDGPEDVSFFRNLLSGVLDPDKLDYLNRDAYFCGIPYGIQDVDFILEEIIPHEIQGLAITQKGLTAVESILFSKYLMYRAVYWHKTVRVATAMIKKALLMGLAAGIIQPHTLYWMDDQDFFSFTRSMDYPPFRMVGYVGRRRLYKNLYSVPFQPGNQVQDGLLSLEKRLQFEEELAREVRRLIGRNVSPEAIVIDIPEPISFEIDLPVYDPGEAKSVRFNESGSVFDRGVVEGFSRTLRCVSLICLRDEEIVNALERLGARRILEEGL
ncbi:hypothetical protein ES703_33618 [subsurface metagenome]